MPQEEVCFVITPQEEFAEYCKKIVAVASDAFYTLQTLEERGTSSKEKRTKYLKIMGMAMEELKKFLDMAPRDLKVAVEKASEFLKTYHRYL